MTKKIPAVLLILTMLILAFAGCSEERGPSFIEGCITKLGKYKDMTVTVTNEETEARMTELYQERATYDVVTEGTVEQGAILFLTRTARIGEDIVYPLSLNEDAYTVGAKDNIPGFDEAIIGRNIGEPFTFSLDIPADYSDETIAGKTLDFTVTASAFRDYPEMNDENVYNVLGEEFQVETLNDFRGYCKEAVYAEKLLDAIVSDTQVDHYIEQDYVAYRDHFMNEYRDDYEDRCTANDYNATFDEYCLEFQGKSAEELEAEVEKNAKDYALKRTVIYAVCEDAGIEASDDLIQNYAVNAFDAAGYATPRSFIKAVGREYLRYEITLSALEAFYSYILDVNTCVSE